MTFLLVTSFGSAYLTGHFGGSSILNFQSPIPTGEYCCAPCGSPIGTVGVIIAYIPTPGGPGACAPSPPVSTCVTSSLSPCK